MVSYRSITGKQYIDGLLSVVVNPLTWWKKYDFKRFLDSMDMDRDVKVVDD